MKNFFNHINFKYNIELVKDMKQYCRQKEKLTKQVQRLAFLMTCQKYGLIPKHIKHQTSKIEDSFSSDLVRNKLKEVEYNFHNRILKLEIKQTHITIKTLKKQLPQEELNLKRTMETIEYEEFIKRQIHQKANLANNIKIIHDNKIDKLKTETLDKFNITFNKDWLVNKTNIQLPVECQWLLSLGKKFTLPTTNKNLSIIHLIADAETYIQNLESDKEKDQIRNNLSRKLSNFKRNKKTNPLEKFILQTYKTTENIVKDYKDKIIITTADKGNKTVIMYRTDYNEKMSQLLEDKNTYKLTRTDPTKKLQKTNNDIVNDLYKTGHIDVSLKRQLYSTSAITPRLYGLPKIHKETMPLRPISSSTNVPCYNLAKHIGTILQTIINRDLNIKNSIQLIEKLKNTFIDDTEIMVSFDVVSLFTNIPTHLAIKTIMGKWDELKQHTNIPKTKFLKMLQFCLTDNNYFTYDNNIYTQTYGMPMGNPLSPTVADIVLDELIDQALSDLTKIGIKVKLMTKYVDDILAIIEKKDIHTILDTLNKQHNKLKFTVEMENQRTIPYLDIQLHISNNKFITDWYTKPTSSGRLINYHSHQPHRTRINTANNLINNVINVSDRQFLNKNIHKLKQTLKRNDFPMHVINKLINKKLDTLTDEISTEKTPLTIDELETQKQYFSITYIDKLTDNKNLRELFPNNNNIMFAHKSNTTLRPLFKSTKDKIAKEQQCNVVYEIPCKGTNNEKCHQIYIGTTKRSLQTRLAEHETDIKKNKNTTAIAQHMLEHGHEPDFESTKILDIENKQNRRMTLESLRIRQKANKTMNTKEDIDKISANYNSILHNIT